MYWAEMSYWHKEMTIQQRLETTPEELSEYTDYDFAKDVYNEPDEADTHFFGWN